MTTGCRIESGCIKTGCRIETGCRIKTVVVSKNIKAIYFFAHFLHSHNLTIHPTLSQNLHDIRRTMPFCGHCERWFGDSCALQQHQKSKKHCYCHKCERFFDHPEALEQHRSVLHIFVCEDCDKIFARLEALQGHQKSTGHCFCHKCNRFFVNSEALEQHCSALHIFTCVGCDQIFTSPEALQQHQKSTNHCYCHKCDRFFVDSVALGQHRSAVHIFTCVDCNRIFMSPEGLEQHQKSTNHCYCRRCDRFFVDSGALGQHLGSPIHAVQFHCCDCDRDFVNEKALYQHLEYKIHKPRSEPKVSFFSLSDWVCEECERGFKDEKGLKQHRLSVVHNPISSITCIGDSRCKKKFTSPSALLHHLESGACSSKVRRDTLNLAVQSNDENRLITGDSVQDDTALMGVDISRTTSRTESVIFTPITDDSSGGCRIPFETWEPQSGMLTPNSENSQPPSTDFLLAMRLTCPLCPVDRKPFQTLEALINHLISPAHSPKVFHCPFYFAGLDNDSQLMKYFSTLSGLMQHIESGACQGDVTTLRKTVEYIEQNLEKMGYRKLRLLN